MPSPAIQVAFALLALGATSCTYSNQPSDSPPATVSVQGIRVTPQSLQLPAIGATRLLQATVSPANATDRAITWESTDSSVVSVDADGLVTAQAAGSGVFVTAITHDGHHQASVNVSVIP